MAYFEESNKSISFNCQDNASDGLRVLRITMAVSGAFINRAIGIKSLRVRRKAKQLLKVMTKEAVYELIYLNLQHEFTS